jgi:peptide-methionine (S)-S-oxide reductase
MNIISFLRRRGGVVAAATGLLVLCAAVTSQAREDAVRIPAPVVDETATGAHEEQAVFAGGCFWGVQAVFQHVKGVKQAMSGYAGGPADKASYEVVSMGNTGHAESVRVTFDPAVVTYGQLLQIYFSVAHDPTQLNRQGPDTGTQYRSTVFAANAQQRKVAEAYIAQLDAAKAYPRPLVTTVEDLKGFYPAEGYHQDYLVNHPDSMYIVINDVPKVKNLAKEFADRYQQQPVLVNGQG